MSFKRSVSFAIIAFSGITLLCCLGFWQLSRAKEKFMLLTQWATSRDLVPFTEYSLPAFPQQNTRFYPVKLTTTLLNKNVILLDNKIHKRRIGYHVLIPALLNDNKLILVHRGWIPAGSSRKQLPTIAPVNGEIIIEGILDFAYRNPFISQTLEENTLTWPLRLQQLDYKLLQTLIGKDIYPMLVMLNKNSPYLFEYSEKQSTWLTPERHQGYAFQWFSLALTLLLLYLYHAWYKRNQHESRV